MLPVCGSVLQLIWDVCVLPGFFYWVSMTAAAVPTGGVAVSRFIYALSSSSSVASLAVGYLYDRYVLARLPK